MTLKRKFKIRVRLREYLSSINVTPYMLGKWVDGVSPQTIYAISNETRRPSLEVLEAILCALNGSGFPTEVGDLLQLEEETSYVGAEIERL